MCNVLELFRDFRSWMRLKRMWNCWQSQKRTFKYNFEKVEGTLGEVCKVQSWILWRGQLPKAGYLDVWIFSGYILYTNILLSTLLIILSGLLNIFPNVDLSCDNITTHRSLNDSTCIDKHLRRLEYRLSDKYSPTSTAKGLDDII